VKTSEKSNEITAIPELLDALLLQGGLVTIDAMGGQKAIAAKIIEREADDRLMVKNNQPTLAAAVEDFFEAAERDGFDGVAHTQADSGMGVTPLGGNGLTPKVTPGLLRTIKNPLSLESCGFADFCGSQFGGWRHSNHIFIYMKQMKNI
jgi:predicted transposase YbfD/YdcC